MIAGLSKGKGYVDVSTVDVETSSAIATAVRDVPFVFGSVAAGGTANAIKAGLFRVPPS